jgi:hypothetical protein
MEIAMYSKLLAIATAGVLMTAGTSKQHGRKDARTQDAKPKPPGEE